MNKSTYGAFIRKKDYDLSNFKPPQYYFGVKAAPDHFRTTNQEFFQKPEMRGN